MLPSCPVSRQRREHGAHDRFEEVEDEPEKGSALSRRTHGRQGLEPLPKRTQGGQHCMADLNVDIAQVVSRLT